jgi:hypothetical protein
MTGADAPARLPSLLVSFTPGLPMEQEPPQVLARLDLPPAQHPRFIYEIRYCHDFILCFQFQEDAEKVMDVLTKRF